jgi:hypothetical protein
MTKPVLGNTIVEFRGPVTGEIVKSNGVFKKIQEALPILEKKFQEISFKSEVLTSYVQMKKSTSIKLYETITLELADESSLVFSSNEKSGIEISSLVSAKRGKGNGTLLMDVFFKILNDVLGFIPPLYLECAGNVSFRDYMVESTIQAQTKFFRKFGFRVDNRKGYPDYVDMKRVPEYSVDRTTPILTEG